MNRTRSLALAMLVASLAGCRQTQQAAPPAPPPAVGVQLAQMKGVTPSYAFVGRIKAVNTLIAKGKTKRFKGLPGRRADVKKAVVTLAAGQSIDVTTGV